MHAAEHDDRQPGIDCRHMLEGNEIAEIDLAAPHGLDLGRGHDLWVADIGKALGTQQVLGGIFPSGANTAVID